MAPYTPPNTHYAHIDLSHLNDEDLHNIVGPHGTHLYTLTTKYRLRYMWMNYEAKRLELWGCFESLKDGAREAIAGHIRNTITARHAAS